MKKENTMNKVVLVMSCLVASSFLSAMEQNQSSGKLSLDNLRPKQSSSQSSPLSLTIAQPDSITPTRSRMPSDPIIRVKSQSKESRSFVKEENAKNIYPYYNEKENK
jgi:hypothetical protein